MAHPTLIYCASGNKRFAQIAIDAGFKYGSRLPATVYFDPWFADQDWKKPNRKAYMDALNQCRPEMATVLDLERIDQLDLVMDWAEEASQYVKTVLLIPKVFGVIPHFPTRIGKANVVLAYSVPTRYGGTFVPVWEFGNRPVHLLGGSPHKQMQIAQYMNVVSTDGNYAQAMAVRHCQFWMPGNASYASNRWWPTLVEADGEKWPNDAPYEAFRRSCENISKAWRKTDY